MPDIPSVAIPPLKRVLALETETIKFDVSKEIESRALETLESHPHFRGRNRWVECRCSKRRLILTGNVPSYYLKQLAQEALRDVEDVDLIDNRIVVASLVYLSEKPVQDIDKTPASHSDSH